MTCDALRYIVIASIVLPHGRLRLRRPVPEAARGLARPCASSTPRSSRTSRGPKVSPVHEIYYEQSGNPDGKPGRLRPRRPGRRHRADSSAASSTRRPTASSSSTSAAAARARPHASLEDNTTWHLVGDMERLREELGIDRWVVFGGLVGQHARRSPTRRPTRSACAGSSCAGSSCSGPRRSRWFYQEGASFLFPDAWEAYLAPDPDGGARRPDRARTTGGSPSPDASVRARAARAWSVWEGSTSKLRPDPKLIARFGGDAFAEAFARIECHYFVNGVVPAPPGPSCSTTSSEIRAHPGRDRPGPLRRGVPDGSRPGTSTGAGRRRSSTSSPTPGTRRMEPGIVDRAGGGDRPLPRPAVVWWWPTGRVIRSAHA